MAGISQREREDKERIAEIKAKLKEPMPLYLYQKLNATLTALQRVQDRRIAARAAETTARRAQRKADQPRPSWLPDNGRAAIWAEREAEREAAMSGD
jgi:hypothetical protein